MLALPQDPVRFCPRVLAVQLGQIIVVLLLGQEDAWVLLLREGAEEGQLQQQADG